MLRVVVADDHPWVREDFATLLSAEPDIEVVATAADGRTAVDATVALRPDVVIMDIRMPGMDGLGALTEINRVLGPGAPAVLVVTTFELDEYVFRALAESAAGFLLKDQAVDDLPAAVRTVACGDAVTSPSVTRRLIGAFARPAAAAAADSPLGRLTPREQHVLRLMATGADNDELAASLVLSAATVKTHVRSILAKLGVRTRTQAVIAAYEGGLVRAGATATGGVLNPGDDARVGPPPSRLP